MKITALAIPAVILLKPTVFAAERSCGNYAKFAAAVGRQVVLVQDNYSGSAGHISAGWKLPYSPKTTRR